MNSKIFTSFVLFQLISFLPIATADQFCFFPSEVQGEYMMQNAAFNGNKFQYSKINITTEFFSPYGQCYTRNESNFVVAISTEDDRLTCFRCFSLRMVSKNILLLFHTEPDINSKCSSSLETVKCPAANKDEKDLYSVILIKTKEKEGPRHHEFCPFDTEMKFDYFINDQKICKGFQSTISNCPSTASMSFDYSIENCSREYNRTLFSMKYNCIGHWNWRGRNHLVVMEKKMGSEEKYKCGTFITDDNDIKLSMSDDCSSMLLKSVSKSQELFQMRKKPFKNVEINNQLQFPSQLQGEWQYMTIRKNNLIYRDPNSFKTYSMSLIEKIEHNKFVVLSKSQCGEESYKCIAIAELAENVIESQIGSESMKILQNFDICGGENFDSKEWITQGKMDEKLVKVRCPISGRFFGRLPDDVDLCSEMWSDCQNHDILNYLIRSCSSGDVYEERRYRCIGHWTDFKTNNVYTFTQRDDIVSSFECFAGLIASEHGNRILIKEAGEGGNCYKIIDLNSFAMEMNQTEKCHVKQSLDYDEIILKPTLDDISTKYEVFDDSNNEIHSTHKPKYDILSSDKKHHSHPDDSENEITSSAPKNGNLLFLCSIVLVILGLTAEI